MERTRIKFCGIRTPADIDAAVDAGADALGFVFVPGTPRYVAPETARDLIARVPAFVSRVGLFVNATQDDVRAIVASSGVDTIQLHGDESPDFCRAFAQPVVKVIRVGENPDLAAAAGRYDFVSALLYDTFDPKARGGTGKAFDWRCLDAVRSLTPPMILAGGLNPDNVAGAVRSVRPFAVDVSGGIEREKGVKDPSLMQAFARAVNQCQ